MAKKKLSEDEIRWILSVDSDEAQQGIHQLTKENKELNKVNKERRALLRQLEAEGKKETKAYKNLESEIESTSQAISKNNQKISELEKKLDVTGLTMSQLRKKAKDLRHQLDSTVKATHPEEYAALEKELGRVTNRMDELRGSGKNIKQEFDVCQRGLSKLKAVAVAFITVKLAGYLKNIGMKAYETRKEFARFEAVLRNTLQSQEKAAKAMKMLQTLAAETPASLKIWTEGFIKLINRGINPTKDELTNMGDLAYSQGKSIDQLIEAILDAMTGENERLKEFGIKASKNGDKVKYTFKGVTTEVNNSEESIKNYLLSLGKLEGVAGSMAIQMQELEGIESNLGDTMDALYNKIGKRLEPMFKSFMGGLSKLLGSVSSAFDTVVEKYDEQFEKVVGLETGLRPLISRYDELKNKTNLNVTEQSELNRLIKDISKIVPSAVTEWDNYAEAISINTEKANEFIETEKKRLAYINKARIEETQSNIDSYQKTFDIYAKLINEGGKWKTDRKTGDMFFDKFTNDELKDFEKKKEDAEKLLNGAQAQMKLLTGQTIDEQINARIKGDKELIAARKRFNEMNKNQLDSWLKDEKNAADKYREIAQEIYDKRFPETTNTSKDKSDPNAVALKDMESAHAAQINEIRLSGQEKQQAEEDINLAILQSDQEYYNKRITQLEKFKATEKKASKRADYDKQIVDSKSKLIETEVSMEKQRIAAVEKLRLEDLVKEEAVTKSLQIYYTNELAARHITQEQYEMLMLSLTSSSAEMRYAIEERYLNDINDLELKNGRLKAEAVKQANDAILTAEQNATNARAALQTKMNDLVKDFKSQFKLTTVDEDLQAQIKVLDAAYEARKEIAQKENLDTTELDEAHERAKENLVRDSENRINQIRNQYGLLSQKQQYELELQQLKDHLDAEELTHEEYEAAVQNLKRDSYKKQFDYYSSLCGGAINALQQAEMANVDAKYDAEIEAAQGNADEVERLEKEKAQKKLNIEKKYADINFAVKASQIIADTSVSIMKALAELGPIAGPIAAALMGVTGAAQLAAANAERTKVKNMTLSGSSGGSGKTTRVVVGRQSGGKIDITRAQDGKYFPAADYDPDKRGFVDKPTVIVGEGPAGKSKEWVASNDAVTNPTIAPLLNILDQAQQAGTIRTLDMNKIIQARMAGFSSGGTITSQPVSGSLAPPSSADSSMNDALSRFCDIMDRLEETGLPAYTLLDEYDKARKLQSRSRKIGSKS
ncbi:hypothetical protein [Phocaeicola sartorii]|uniref:hypothetical protein n=1 Tax=Phocaeicola sartorii TaxID=671267 RepID=UPI003517B488